MNGTATTGTPTDGGVPNRRAYSVPEVAVLLGGVSERYVWTLLSRNDLESIKVGQRRFVPTESLDAFVEKLREEERAVRAAAVGSL